MGNELKLKVMASRPLNIRTCTISFDVKSFSEARLFRFYGAVKRLPPSLGGCLVTEEL